MNIADRIQYLRKSKGISQEELADKIGVSRQAVSKWESEQSSPDMDKIIILSDFFEVTTDYILKGIENEQQQDEKKVNANIFVAIATALNFIGLIVASAMWHEIQTSMAIVTGLILMAVGCMVFGIGLAVSTENVEKAKGIFWTINIWLLIFMPLSAVYNVLFLFTHNPFSFIFIAPYPLFLYSHWFPVFILIYIVICLSVVFLQVKRKNKK